MSTYERIAGPAPGDRRLRARGARKTVSSGFERRTTVIHLQGGGDEGLGEDVTYDADDQIEQQDARPRAPARRRLDPAVVLGSISARLDHLQAGPPKMPMFPNYRGWGFEEARRSTSRCARLGARWPRCSSATRAVTFVVSSHGRPADARAGHAPAARYPDLRFKLDGTPDWDDGLIAGLVESGAVDSIDFKGAYKGMVVDVDTGPELYRQDRRDVPRCLARGPDLEDEVAPRRSRPSEDRITWDAPIHSIDDILPSACCPRRSTSSRGGSARSRRSSPSTTSARSDGMGHGGGQYELGVGRAQIQYLAALFHPGAPNDIAPAGYDALDPEPGLPAVPLERRSAPASAGGRRLGFHAPEAATDPRRVEVGTRGDAEPRDPQRRGAGGRDALRAAAPGAARRPCRGAHGRQALARALPRRDRAAARRSACSCAAWPRRRWRWPSAAPGTSRPRRRSSGRRPRSTASCCCCASWA